MKRVLSPSLLSADFISLKEQLDILKMCGIEYLHYDVMDGRFVPDISFGTPVLKCIRSHTDMKLDVHLMTEDPDSKVEIFSAAGADMITVHEEACIHLDRTVNHIKSLGKKAGVAVNPATPVSLLEEIAEEADMILIMSVNPGYGGQKYIPYCTEKIRKIRELSDRKNPGLSVQVDGGISLSNVRTVLDAGADNIVSGSAVFKGNMESNIRQFSDIFKEYV